MQISTMLQSVARASFVIVLVVMLVVVSGVGALEC